MNMTVRMPVIFIDHGSPMDALADNAHTRSLRAWGKSLPRPRAVLSVSAHWYVDGVKVLSAPNPETIHDFNGFPDELYQVRYSAPGHPELAAETRLLLDEAGARLSEDWGLDHGTWSPLRHLFPRADVPVFQVSVDRRRAAREHLELGRLLKPLRERGVLIMGSGNIVHNLARLGPEDAPVYSWARDFDAKVREALLRDDRETLLAGAAPSPAVPTPDHYLPLLSALGAAEPGEPVTLPAEGFAHGSISRRAVQWG
jgi:4,5-DOPA dioxygenase extradiol